MIKRIQALVSIFFLINLGVLSDVLAWDDSVTHKDLSLYAAKNSTLDQSKGAYLNKVGLPDGLNTWLKWAGNNKLKEGYITDWLREGAMLEDRPVTRSLNHFHNPLKSWESAGLHDLLLTGTSSLVWSQDSNLQQNFSENWSWERTRSLFYSALKSINDADRQANLAQMFVGLGHQIHLLQDTAVPEHVRNDAHPKDALLGKSRRLGTYYFETWTKNNAPIAKCLFETHNLLPPDLLTKCGQYNINESVIIQNFYPNVPFNVSYNNYAPVTQLFDAEQYDGLNASAGINQGLSEYTNANFFSNDTIFAAERYSSSDAHYFPFPKKTSTNLENYIGQNNLLEPEVVIGEDNIPDTSFWIKKERDGEEIAHFVKPGYFNIFINPIVNIPLYVRTFYRDEKCHEDYAKLLTPRAVGYSAGLLDYFFRGSVDLTLPSSGYYAKTTPGQGFTTFSLLAKNTTSTGELMDYGTIELVVIYRLAYDDPFINYPPDYNFQAATEYSYIVVPEASGRRSIPRDTPVELTFDLSSNPIPLYAIDVNVQLVYHGRLGSEDGAVVVGLKDISEPTPVDILNDMDVVCLNGIWYPAGSQDAIDQVDSNQDGIPEWDIYAHNIENIYYKVSPSSNPVYASPSTYDSVTPSLNAGGFERALFILTEKNFNYSLYEAFLNADPRDPWGIQPMPASLYSGTSITNQTYYVDDAATCAPAPAPCHIWWYPTFLTYKNVEMWGGGGILYYNNAYPAGSECSCYEGLVRECPAQLMAKTTLRIESAQSQGSGHGHVDLKSKKGYLRRAQQQGGPSGQTGRHPN